jgi:hypothetical protein
MQHKRYIMTTVILDEQSYNLLIHKKRELKKRGIARPTFSDAVRFACGAIDLGEKTWD